MSNLKIAMIGGGSAFCPVVLSALVDNADVFENCQLMLMDINEVNLDIIHRLGTQMVKSSGMTLDVRKTLDLYEALEGADFVLTSFRPGGFESRALDEKIPLKYGIIGQETIGPGGFFMAMRSVNVIRNLVDLLEKVSPKAFLINYTNPTNIVTEAVMHNTPIKIIGLCDQAQGDKRRIADALGVDVRRIDYDACGLNHATWSTRFAIDGIDAIPIILERLEEIQENSAVPAPVRRMFRLASWYERIPNRYFQYYFFHEEMLQEALAAKYCRAEEIMLELPRYFEHYLQESRKTYPNVTEMRGGTKAFGDYAVEVIRAIVQNSGDKFILNVMNNGALPGFNDERVVEVPCSVDENGAHPIKQKPMPHEGLGVIKMLAEYQALTAQVAWQGDRKSAICALASNPLVQSMTKAEALVDEMIVAHKQHLPETFLQTT